MTGKTPPRRRQSKSPAKSALKTDAATDATASDSVMVLPVLPLPTKNMGIDYDHDRMLLFCQHLAGGLSQTRTASLLGMTNDIRKWRKRDKVYIATLIDIAESAFVAENLGHIRKHARGRSWQAAAWLVERRFPSEFGQSGKRSGSGDQELNVNIAIISAVPRPYETDRRKDKIAGETGNSPAQIAAHNEGLMDVIDVKAKVVDKENDDGD